MSISDLASTAPSADAPLSPEDEGRAVCYALLARLFYAGASADLIDTLLSLKDWHTDPQYPLAQTWQAMLKNAEAHQQSATIPLIVLEYDEIFIGTGQAPISLYASHYLSESWREHTLVNLRGYLTSIGLSRLETAHEPEDHLAALCDTMRLLILRNTAESVGEQAIFFNTYIAPWYASLVHTIRQEPRAQFYQSVSAWLMTFLDIEKQVWTEQNFSE